MNSMVTLAFMQHLRDPQTLQIARVIVIFLFYNLFACLVGACIMLPIGLVTKVVHSAWCCVFLHC